MPLGHPSKSAQRRGAAHRPHPAEGGRLNARLATLAALGDARLRRRLDARPEYGVLRGAEAESAGHGAHETVARVLLRANPDTNLAALFGARVRSRAGDVASATVSMDGVRAMAAHPDVQHVELARPLSYDLDGVRRSLRLSVAAQGAARGGHGLCGDGVIVAVLDAGIDVHHPAFLDAHGHTRITHLWDQTLRAKAGEHAPSAGYGVEYVRRDIQAQLHHTRTRLAAGAPPEAYAVVRHEPAKTAEPSHGTLVTACAAGRGAPDAALVGVAPHADIVFVALQGHVAGRPFADSAAVLDAFAYAFDVAKAAGKPCVVNLSASDNLGAHDGSALLEQCIDALLVEPGRAVTLAAGNQGAADKHATASVPEGGTVVIDATYGPKVPGGAYFSDVIEVWGSSADDVAVTVTSPWGYGVGPLGPGESVTVPMGPNARSTMTVTTVQQHPANPSRSCVTVHLDVARSEPRILDGTWHIALTGEAIVDGRVHAWMDRVNGVDACFTTFVDRTCSVAIPATARRALTVGNHLDALADPAEVLSQSSGLGPTLDGRTKPDFVAPGTVVHGPGAVDRSVVPIPFAAEYTVLEGTSFAAPVVAGVCALLFQRTPTLTSQGVHAAIAAAADAAVGVPMPDPGWGLGRVRVDPSWL